MNLVPVILLVTVFQPDTNEPQEDDPDYVPSRKRSSRIASRMERKAAQPKVIERDPDKMVSYL